MKSEKLETADALKLCLEYDRDITPETLRAWCKQYGIGKKVVGRFKIDRQKLIDLLEGKNG